MSQKDQIEVTSFDVLPDSTMRVSALFKYFQQAARHHLDSLGLRFDVMRERKCVFVITRMKTVFYSSIKGYDKIDIETSSRKIKGAVFTRDYVVRRGGEVIAEASTQWALIDLETRRICRPSVYADYFSANEELCSFDNIPKCVIPEELGGEYSYSVVFSDIDENHHMNNTRYTDICLDAIGGIGQGECISEVCIDFLSEARLGDKLVVNWDRQDDTLFFSANNATNDKACFRATIKMK